MCRHGPCGPIDSLHPWNEWVPPDLHGFFQWVFDSLDVLNGFTLQVAVCRRDGGTNWLREDLGSRPYAWLRPDFVPPSPFLVIKDPQYLGFWWSHILLTPSFVKPRCLLSVGLVILFLLLTSFWILWVTFYLRSLILIFPGLRGVICRMLHGLKSLWAWNEVKALPLPWFSGLAILLELVERAGVWPQGLLDAYIAMIPKADGDSTPVMQRPLSVLPVVERLWASLRLGHLR